VLSQVLPPLWIIRPGVRALRPRPDTAHSAKTFVRESVLVSPWIWGI
jgi:hypothetical protein